MIDHALPALSEESTLGIPRMQLFFVMRAAQTLPEKILSDSDSVWNLIDETVSNRLFDKRPIRDPGDVRVIKVNGNAIDLKGFAVLPIFLGSILV